jgi:hypothetical protein
MSRVLKGHNDTLSTRCLEIAEALYEGSPENERLLSGKLFAAVELYLATEKDGYKDFVLDNKDYIVKNISRCGWFVGRFDKKVGNKKFSKAIREALPSIRETFDGYSKLNPYGVAHNRGNRSSGSWEPQSHTFNYCLLYES